MTATGSPAPSPALPRRIAAAVAGLALLAGTVVLTAGIGLAGPIGMAITSRVRRRTHRAYTRGTGWLGAMTATAIALFAVMAFFVSRIPRGTLETARQQALSQQQRNPPKVPKLLQRLAPASMPTPESQARTDSLLSSPTTMLTFGLIGGAILAVSLGALIGTASWACATLAWYGLVGRWPGEAAA